ncbi:MAG: DUF4147 domain-containing protein [Candidatus Aenigmarchaeota archaeon]|nr:DUF4147 domain-containing protein [Candidatus Aenigmarchaeota archaeon]
MNRKTKTKRDILSIIDYALKETSIEKAIRSSVKLNGNILKIKKKKYDLKNFDNIYVMGSGKASYRMAKSLNRILGKKISEGLVIYTKKEKKLGKIKVLRGTHPFPSESSIKATKKLISLAEKTNKNDLTIYLLSGGTSSLLCHPTICLKKLIKLNEELLKSKRNIKQVNRIRRKYSSVKGGKLLEHFHGKIINLVISDVVGDSLEFIGSGSLHKKSRGVDNFILANNRMLLEKAAEKARKLGYGTKIVYPNYEGNPESLVTKLKGLSKNLKSRSCIISGGEFAFKVRGKGDGGPNQDFVLRCRKIKGVTVASIDSDGIDGNSKAAGAIADEKDFQKHDEEEIQGYLKNSDSYTFFRKRNCSIITGPTGTNLNDLRIMIKL